MKNAWYNTKGAENDVVISSRIRFARNLCDYPFASRLDAPSAREIIGRIREALGKGFETIDFESLSPIEARSYMEEHYVSPEFLELPLPHALALSDDRRISVMMCEEDHIRLQAILPGLALKEAYEAACETDDRLGEQLHFAFDEKLGYLTHCPTNIGTGMRASVMLFLPALAASHQLSQIASYLTKVGLTMRGLYGEGSDAEGYLYQISNQVTLGVSEEDLLHRLSEVITQIITLERKARNALKSDNADAVTDTIMRAWGTMHYAHLMTSSEFMQLFAEVRLGVALGIIREISYEKLGELMIHALPATMMRDAGHELTDRERDIARAAYIRSELAHE